MSLYFVVNSFPQIHLGSPPLMSYEEAREMLLMNLSPRELRELERFQLQIDIKNIRALWLSQPLDPRGNLNEKELEEDLLVRSFLPAFVGEFLDRYESMELRLRYFSYLMTALYEEFKKLSKGALYELVRLEREIRLCLTLLRAKRLGGDLGAELQFEDPTDPFVMQLLLQKDTKEALLPQEYEDLKPIFLEHSGHPLELHRRVGEFRMRKIEEMQEGKPFTMEQVLGFLARLLIVEDWANLDLDRGVQCYIG